MTYNAYPADLKIKCNGTKVKSQDHGPRCVPAAIVCDKYLLQSLVTVGEVVSGQPKPETINLVERQ